jgi:hypothetical protein
MCRAPNHHKGPTYAMFVLQVRYGGIFKIFNVMDSFEGLSHGYRLNIDI